MGASYLHFKKKKAQAGNELSNILPKSSHARKKPPQPHITNVHPKLAFFPIQKNLKVNPTFKKGEEKNCEECILLNLIFVCARGILLNDKCMSLLSRVFHLSLS